MEGYFGAKFILPNLGYKKDVEVHYSFDNWQTTHIGEAVFSSGIMVGYSFVRYPNANNMEVWSFLTRGPEAQTTSADMVQFAVKYTVNGETYWNNNNGANFIATVAK